MERPILFSGPMVRAILDGRKTQTRRIVKSSIADFHTMDFMHLENDGSPEIAWFESGRVQEWVKCPYGSVGDRLWVREAWCHAADDDDRMKYNADGNLDSSCCHYRADGYEVRHVDGAETKGGLPKSPWVPSIHMPRCASRITLEITGIRVERLNAISEEDALSEGISFKCFDANCNVIRHAVWPKEPTLSDRANAKDTLITLVLQGILTADLGRKTSGSGVGRRARSTSRHRHTDRACSILPVGQSNRNQFRTT